MHLITVEDLVAAQEKVSKLMPQIISNQSTDREKYEKFQELKKNENECAAILKKLVSPHLPHKSLGLIVQVLDILGQIYEIMGTITKDPECFTWAAIFYQYCANIESNKLHNLLNSNIYKGKLCALNIQLLDTITGVSTSEDKQYRAVDFEKYKEKIKHIRAEASNNIKEIEKHKYKYNELTYVSLSTSTVKEITDNLKHFLRELYNDSQTELSHFGLTPPCAYAVISLGSLAHNQATPYSDLEFAILTENLDYLDSSDESTKNYFTYLTHLVNLKLISAGETRVPIEKYGVDLSHLAHRGIQLDPGGRTPLGIKGQACPLIRTVEGMMEYLKNEGIPQSDLGSILPYILEHTSHVYGDHTLSERYQDQALIFLKSTDAAGSRICEKRAITRLCIDVKEGTSVYPSQQATTSSHIKGELDMWDPYLLLQQEETIIDVKEQIYRIPDRLIYLFGLYFGVKKDHITDVIDALCSRDIINKEAAQNLKFAAAFANNLRLVTYNHNNGHISNVSVLDKDATSAFISPFKAKQDCQLTLEHKMDPLALPIIMEPKTPLTPHQSKTSPNTSYSSMPTYYAESGGGADEIRSYISSTPPSSDVYSMQNRDLKEGGALFRFLYTVAALHTKLTELTTIGKDANIKDPKTLFKDDNFYSDSPLYEALIHSKVGRRGEALERLNALPANAIKQNNQESFKIKKTLGNLYSYYDKNEIAIPLYEKCLEIIQSLPEYKHQHTEIADLFNRIGILYLRQEKHEDAKTYFNMSIEECNKNKLQAVAPSEYIIAINGLSIIHMYYGHYKEAIGLLIDPVKLLDSDSSQIQYSPALALAFANTLHNVGLAYHEQGNYKVAKAQYKASRDMLYKFNRDEPHFLKARIFANIGRMYLEHSLDEEQAIERQAKSDIKHLTYSIKHLAKRSVKYLEKSLKEYITLYKDHNSLDIVEVYNNLGKAYCLRGDYETAKKCFNKILETYGSHPVATAKALCGIGYIWCKYHYYEHALESYIQGLQFIQEHKAVKVKYEILYNIGIMEIKQKEYDKALSTLTDALSLTQRVCTYKGIKDIEKCWDAICQLHIKMHECAVKILYNNISARIGSYRDATLSHTGKEMNEAISQLLAQSTIVSTIEHSKFFDIPPAKTSAHITPSEEDGLTDCMSPGSALSPQRPLDASELLSSTLLLDCTIPATGTVDPSFLGEEGVESVKVIGSAEVIPLTLD